MALAEAAAAAVAVSTTETEEREGSGMVVDGDDTNDDRTEASIEQQYMHEILHCLHFFSSCQAQTQQEIDR